MQPTRVGRNCCGGSDVIGILREALARLLALAVVSVCGYERKE